jgi:hypothetical protein
MTKKPNLLDPKVAIAKALGGRAVCYKCAPYERERFLGRGPQAHLRCDEADCGCICQDDARKN